MARSQRSRQKIEPLNYQEMASAPALKGMTSFLEITPAEFTAAQERVQSVGQSTSRGAVKSPGHLSIPGSVSSPGGERVTPSQARATAHLQYVRRPTALKGDSGVETFIRDSAPPRAQTPRSEILEAGLRAAPGDETYPGSVSAPTRAAGTAEVYGGSSTYCALTPGRGRSKVRRCVLAQDGHSLGEEAIYQILWRAGRPESADPNSSRIIRMGSAELGSRVNMAKKNVRINISRLFEKLSIEILENFATTSSQARLYRVFSFKQILERRKAAGLQYVLRNKGVVFCTAEGDEIVTSPAYVSCPGVETYRPAPLKPSRAVRAQQRSELAEALSRQANVVAQPVLVADAADPEDVAIISKAMNRYWAADEAAAIQLLVACRQIRPNATADEIAFFVTDKVEIARRNTKILNPTGMILATVPRCFEGETFEAFRRRRHQRQERLAPSPIQSIDPIDPYEAEAMRRALQRILDNPNSSEANRRRAQEQLAAGNWPGK